MAAHLTLTDRRPTTRRDDDRSIAVTTTDGIAWTWLDLVREFEPALAGYARSRGIRQPDDVVQDVLATAVSKLDDFHGDRANLRSWLFTLAYRRIADRHRRFYRSPLVLVADHEPTPADDDDIDVGLLRSEALGDAMAAFDILTDRQRAVLQRRIIDERSPREVAAELGLSPANVRVIQCRALARVRDHLLERTGAPDRTAAGIMWLVGGRRLVAAIRDLGDALPVDRIVGGWIDQVRAGAATSGTGATGSAAAAAVAVTTHGSGIASVAAFAGQATATGVVAAKVGAATLGMALAVGTAGATVDSPTTATASSTEVASTIAGAAPTGDPTGVGPVQGRPSWPVPAGQPPVAAVAAPGPAATGDHVARNDAHPVSSDDVNGGTDDTGSQPLSRDQSPVATAGDHGTAPPVQAADDELDVDLDLPTDGLPIDLHLSAAGALILDPLADTAQVVEDLRGHLDLRERPRAVVDDTVSDLVGRVGSATTERDRVAGEVEEVVREGTDRATDTVDRASSAVDGVVDGAVDGAVDAADRAVDAVDRVVDTVETAGTDPNRPRTGGATRTGNPPDEPSTSTTHRDPSRPADDDSAAVPDPVPDPGDGPDGGVVGELLDDGGVVDDLLGGRSDDGDGAGGGLLGPG